MFLFLIFTHRFYFNIYFIYKKDIKEIKVYKVKKNQYIYYIYLLHENGGIAVVRFYYFYKKYSLLEKNKIDW